MNTGMRKGELFSLRWENVDLTNKLVTVTAENAKSGKNRHIPLSNEARDTLIGWQEDTQEQGYVFEGEPNKPLTDVKKAWGNLLIEAKMSEFNFHNLRHHFASKLVMAGVDLNTVRELLGHANLDDNSLCSPCARSRSRSGEFNWLSELIGTQPVQIQ